MPRGSLASRSRRCFGSQQAKANMPRSQLTASGPCRPSARSMTAVSPVDWNVLPLVHQAPPQIAEVVDLAVEDR